MKIFLIGASLLIAGSGMLCAQNSYVAPKLTQLMFQVDKLPMDKGTRKWLSANLTTLAKREHDGSAIQQRLTAQLLILAMRLDADNKVARETNQNLVVNGITETVDIVESTKASSKVQLAIKNLTNTEEGSEAHLLAEYLKDVLFVYDPGNYLLIDHQSQSSLWRGILPEPEPIIAAPQNDAEIEEIPSSIANLENELALKGNEVEKEPEKELKPETQYTRWEKLNASMIRLLPVLYKNNDILGSYNTRTEPVELNVSIMPKDELDSSIELTINPIQEPEVMDRFRQRIEELVQNRFGEFQSAKIEITTEPKLHSNAVNDIVLPVCLQLLAAEKGLNIEKGAMVLGRLEGNKIKRNWDFWKKLKYADTVNSKRIILPAEAEADLIQLLALEKESFFVKNEVFIVQTLEDALKLLGENSDNDTKEQFADIQRIIGTKSVGPYAVDRQIRKRLEDILGKNPNHLSAKMILLRGDSSRNKRLERYYIAKEASYILNKLGWIAQQNNINVNAFFLEEKVTEIEGFKKKFAELTDTKDRDLIGYLANIAETFEVVIRNKKKRESKSTAKTIKEAMEQFSKQHKEAKAVIDEAIKTLPKVAK